MRTPIVLASTILISLAGTALTGCQEEQSPAGGQSASITDEVATTFYPTTYFAERISGDLVAVRSGLPEGEDPIFWQPDAATLSNYQNAKLVITNGADFEKWVAGAALPRGRTVESLSDADLDATGGPITMETTTHSHGPSGEHTHEGLDGHTWVSPDIAIVQATNIAEAMKTAWPQHAEAFDANLASLVEDLEMLRVSLDDLTPLVGEHRLLASHPAYNYLARDLGWDVHNLDLDPESDDVQAIVDAVHDALHHHEDHAHDHEHGEDHGHDHSHEEGRAHDEGDGDQDHDHEHSHGDEPVILLWEGEPTGAIRAAIADELGVTSVLFTPAEGQPESGDYMDAMRANLDRLREALGG
ncbi:MAG: metal ABC transporter substrate-binding protein [Phycisphaerales bacterium]|jgi:zinc transport system substrate-binding protein